MDIQSLLLLVDGVSLMSIETVTIVGAVITMASTTFYAGVQFSALKTNIRYLIDGHHELAEKVDSVVDDLNNHKQLPTHPVAQAKYEAIENRVTLLERRQKNE